MSLNIIRLPGYPVSSQGTSTTLSLPGGVPPYMGTEYGNLMLFAVTSTVEPTGDISVGPAGYNFGPVGVVSEWVYVGAVGYTYMFYGFTYCEGRPDPITVDYPGLGSNEITLSADCYDLGGLMVASVDLVPDTEAMGTNLVKLSSLVPRVTTANYVPNPSFTYDTVGVAPAAWSTTNSAHLISGGTLTVHNPTGTPPAPVGGQVCWFTATAQNEGGAISLGVLPADTYTFSTYVAGASGGELVGILAGFGVAPNIGTASATMTTSWQRMSCSFVSDGSTESFAYIRLGGSGGTAYVDACQVAPGSGPVGYVDGDAAGYEWDGTGGDSTTSTAALTVMATLGETTDSSGGVDSVTAGDSTITVGGTSANRTVKVTANTFDAYGAASTEQQRAEAAEALLANGPDWINVTLAPYTADRTGTTDSTATIQAAINAASPGQVVYFPHGIYRITAPLVLGEYSQLRGDFTPGYDVASTCTLKAPGGAAAFDSIIHVNATFYDSAIRGLYINANDVATYAVHIEGAGEDVDGGLFIEHCQASGATSHGFFCDGSTQEIQAVFFSDTFSTSNFGDGFHFTHFYDGHLHHCVSQSNLGSGFTFDSTDGSIGSTVLEGCRSEDNSLHGYYMTGTSGCNSLQFNGCFTDHNGHAGFYIDSQYYTDDSPIMISNCYLNRDGYTTGITQPGAGFYLSDANVIINGCQTYVARGDPGNGLWAPTFGLYAASSTVQIDGCRFFGVLGGFFDGGSNSILWGS